MTIIRDAIQEDAMGVFKLVFEMHATTDFQAFRFSPERAIVGVVAWIKNSKVLVAESGGEIVGMLIASLKDSWFSDEKYVHEELFYVAKAHRGGRAAYMLMKSFLAWARQSGARHIRAGVATGTGAAAERLYQHFGMNYTGGNFALHFSGEEQCAVVAAPTTRG